MNCWLFQSCYPQSYAETLFSFKLKSVLLRYVYVIIDNQIKTCGFLEFCNYAMILSATGIGVSVFSTNEHAPLLSLVIKRREGVGQGFR